MGTMMVAGGTVEIVCLRLAWWRGGWRGRDWHGDQHGEGFFFSFFVFFFFCCGCCGQCLGLVVVWFLGLVVAWWLVFFGCCGGFVGGSCCGRSCGYSV